MPRSLHLCSNVRESGIILLSPPVGDKTCQKCGQKIVSLEDGGDQHTDSFTENPGVWANPPGDWERCV